MKRGVSEHDLLAQSGGCTAATDVFSGPRTQRFGLRAAALEEPAAGNRYYVIAATPRSGSSLLAEGLAATGRAGNPDEFFDLTPEHEAHWQRRYHAPDGPGYVERIVEASRTANGVFGFKLHWHQAPALRRRLVQSMSGTDAPDQASALDLLRQRFPGLQFVWLTRRNKLAQAISYYRAAHSKVWRIWTDGASARPEPAGDVVYDRATIEHYLRMVMRMDAEWRGFFTQHRIAALTLVYEDFVRSYGDTIARVLQFLDLSTDDLTVPPPKLQRLADPISAAWERRFRQEVLSAAPVQAPSPAASRTANEAAHGAKRFIAYDVGSGVKMRLAPGGPKRTWMDATPKRFAYRCLPMVIANQWGWLIRLAQQVGAIWDGSNLPEGLRIIQPGGGPAIASSHFGCGILTFHVGYLFRTPPDFNLHVRGPANAPKDGVSPLEAIIESDWTEATFTMNWKVTRPGHPIIFEADEPIAMISPLRRGELEQFVPEIRWLAEDADLLARHDAWSASRSAFNADLRTANSPARNQGWQKHYTHGHAIHGHSFTSHQTAITLLNFKDRR